MGALLLSVVSVGTVVAIAELAVRMLDPLGLSYYEEGARYHRDKIADGELIYRHRPGLRARYQGVEVAINELGFRDRPLTRREPGELRIMLLGDSTVFGWGVAAEDTFGASLEHRLGRLLARPVRAVNTGVGSYNTDQQLGVLRRYADVVEPDIVLLLYSQNDVNQRGWRIAHAEGLAQTVRRLAGRSWLYRLLQHARHYGGLGRTRDPTPIDRSAPGWRSSMRALAAVADHCRARKIPFVAMLAQWHREPLNEALGEDLSRVAAAEGFPFVDARPWFDGRDLRGLTNSVVDGHLNAKGLDLLAERTVGFLTVNELVPPR